MIGISDVVDTDPPHGWRVLFELQDGSSDWVNTVTVVPVQGTYFSLISVPTSSLSPCTWRYPTRSPQAIPSLELGLEINFDNNIRATGPAFRHVSNDAYFPQPTVVMNRFYCTGVPTRFRRCYVQYLGSPSAICKPMHCHVTQAGGPSNPYSSCSTLATDISVALVLSSHSPLDGQADSEPLSSSAPTASIRNHVSTFSRLFFVFFVFKKSSPFTFKRHEVKVQKSRSKSTKRHEKDKFKKTK